MLSYSAYVAEVFRAGIQSIHPSQRAAALALGLTETQSLRHVVLPQAVRRVMPPLLNDFVALQKDAALVSIAGPIEAFRQAQIDPGRDVQLHAADRRGRAVRARDDPAGSLRRPAAGTAAGLRGRRPVTPVLELRGVTKAYGDVPVLRGIDLSVDEHRAIALIGASGSGKSTLLRCLDLLEEIDDGDVLIDGEVVTDPGVDPVAARRRLGMVFQAFNLFPHMTVLENLTLAPQRVHGLSRRRPPRAGGELLARFGLAGREHDQPDQLSGGQQQRVAIARALRHPPARAAARRDHQRAGSRAGGRGHGRGPRAEGRGHDDGARHARDGLRPRGRRRGVLPPRGADRGARRARRTCSAPRSGPRRSASCHACSTRAGSRPGAATRAGPAAPASPCAASRSRRRTPRLPPTARRSARPAPTAAAPRSLARSGFSVAGSKSSARSS